MQSTDPAAPRGPSTGFASRAGAGVLAGYVFAWGFVSLGTVLGVAAGKPYDEAEALVFLLVFPLFLAAFCWAFAVRRASHAWVALLGGGGVMTLFAWLGARWLG